MIGIGVTLFLVSIITLVIGIILFIISIGVKDLRKPAKYILLVSGILLLVSFSLCSYIA